MLQKKYFMIRIMPLTLLFCFFMHIDLHAQKTKAALDAAEVKMFDTIMKADMDYWKNDVNDDYITINSDGVMQNKTEAIADSAKQRQMFANTTCKLYDRTVRIYDNTGIVTGRLQGLYADKLIAEVFYTEIWLYKNNKWMFNGWQGTFTKNSPPMPKP